MTDITETPAAPAPGPACTPGVDEILRAIVNGIDHQPGFEFGITLHVQGSVITGQLCAAQSYFDELSQILRDFDAARPNPAREMYSRLFTRASELLAPSKDHERDQSTSPSFIHLRQAHLLAPTGLRGGAALPAALWRGRFDQVCGWSFGSVDEAPYVAWSG